MIVTTCDKCGREYDDGYSGKDCIENDEAKFMVYNIPKDNRGKRYDFCPRCTLRMLREIPLDGEEDWPDSVDDKRKGDGPFIWKH